MRKFLVTFVVIGAVAVAALTLWPSRGAKPGASSITIDKLGTLPVDELSQKVTSPYDSSGNGWCYPIHVAAKNCDVDAVTKILATGGDPNCVCSEGDSVLCWMARTLDVRRKQQ